MINRRISIKSRLNNLEDRRGPDIALLRFADGSTRSVTLRDPLRIFCDAMSVVWHNAHGKFREPPCTPPKLSEKISKLIDLIGRAQSIETDDKFLHHVRQMCADTRFYDGCQSEAEATARYSERRDRLIAASRQVS